MTSSSRGVAHPRDLRSSSAWGASPDPPTFGSAGSLTPTSASGSPAEPTPWAPSRTEVKVPPAKCPHTTTALIIEDSVADAGLITEFLIEAQIAATCTSNMTEAEHQLRRFSFDYVISDLMLPDAQGLEAVRHIAELAPLTPLIVLTGLNDENLALRAVQQGAQDFLVKGELDAPLLRRTLRHARERKQVFNRLTYLTHHDSLTGALNRVALLEQLERELQRARERNGSLALIYIDLDHFKEVNDTLGHDAGDLLLKEVTGRLQQAVGAAGSVARLAGDEFAVLLPNLPNASKGHEFAGQIRAQLLTPIDVLGNPTLVTASLGLASYPDDATSINDLLRQADTEMYRGKRRRRRSSVDRVSSSLTRELQLTGDLAAALPNALAAGELRVHYQPRLTAAGRRVVAFEAMLRWARAGAEDLLTPDLLNVLAPHDEDGAVTRWLISEACQQLTQWRSAQRTDLRIGLALAPHQLQRPELLPELGAVLRQFSMPARSLELELPEHLLLHDAERTSALIQDVRKLDVRVAIGSLSAGATSLAYLGQVYVDSLILDHSFISQIDKSPERALIINTIAVLGHDLGLEVLATGITTPTQVSFLRSAGCDVMQGSLFAPPGEASSFGNGQLASPAEDEGGSTVRMRRVRDPDRRRSPSKSP
jgi:diguanylate cyclase (GGDEF)-like protein